MKIVSSLLGELEIDEEQVINFPEGLPAFEDQRRFIIMPMDENGLFFYLQAVDNPDLCFIMADPFPFFPNYEAELGDEEVGKLNVAEAGNNISLFTILTIPEDFKNTTANLLAPILINGKQKIGLQFILINNDYNTKHLIFPPGKSAENKTAGEGL